MEAIENKTDFSESETKELQAFAEAGFPSISKITESFVFKWFSLYMEDKTYSEIAEISKSEKIHILYMANKLNWYQKKIDYYKEVQSRITEKMTKTKVKSMDFLSSFVGCMNKVYGTKINKALMNNDLTEIETIDTKVMSLYFKSLESLEKLSTTPKQRDSSPSVNININSETTIKKVDENTLTMTPGKDYSEVLDEMLALQEELEKS